MKKKDFIWLACLAIIVLFLTYPTTHHLFMTATKAHPYLMGFIKVAILASMGEILALRISLGYYRKPVGFLWRFIIWGFLGMAFALVFDVFAMGTLGVMEKGLLPNFSNLIANKFITAFFTSTLMNLIFGPTFMALHRITDTYIDLGQGQLNRIFKIKLVDVVNHIDWYGFLSFVLLKTVPLFWIPAHTITFMLPGEYRVLMASFLSIALGGILAFSKRKKAK
ncbi:hypothetical protein KQI42_13535 [Tissierella sp. MSJ-40]|uniref:Mpv17 / PMP22 family protein n=1 Tax=Tissierella simiarum TaxID=2841534 RepID=A0ABS6EA22_9FIRM|nr:hypothetical protein [Tissierella simiarum]MBU5439044.1 hypothetical protein [Tissierella simiarum]